jgi:CubicO group peptidase (beta-lactamase class C family)
MDGEFSLTFGNTGDTIYQESFGSRTIDGGDLLTPDSLTWIASATKLVASIAGMQVVEKGLIGLDDDVRPLLPGLADAKVLLGWDCPDDTESAAQPTGRPLFEDVQDKITLRSVERLNLRPVCPNRCGV